MTAPAPFTFRSSRGLLQTYGVEDTATNGPTVGVMLVDHDGAAAATTAMQWLSELASFEVADARGTQDVIYVQDGESGVLRQDPAADTPYESDTTGATPAGVVLFDIAGVDDTAHRLIAFLPVEEGDGFAGWTIDEPAAGLARVRQPTSLSEYGPWHDLLEGTATATLPGFITPAEYGFAPGLRWRTCPDGQVEFGGSFAYWGDGGGVDPQPPPTASLSAAVTVATLPPEARPVDAPLLPCFARDGAAVLAAGSPASEWIDLEVVPSTGDIGLVADSTFTPPVFFVAYTRWDVA
jgi:hypothetical protein